MSLKERSVYVTDLPSGATAHDLETLFHPVGTVKRSVLLCDEKNQPVGAAFVCLSSSGEALTASMTLTKDDLAVKAVSEGQLQQLLSFIGDDDLNQKPPSSGSLANLYKKLTEAEKKAFLANIMNSLAEDSGSSDSKVGITQTGKTAALHSDAVDRSREGQVPNSVNIPAPVIMRAPAQEIIVKDPPRLSPFSGTPGRDASFGRWKSEVLCLKDDPEHSSNAVLNAVRRSLRSPAADLIVHIDRHATVKELLRKLETVYGNILTGQTILQKFYSEKQSASETIAEWACRLEDLAYTAEEKKMVERAAVEGMLKAQFYSGIKHQRIKDALRQQRNALSFEDLVVQARELEEEYSTTSSTKQQQSQPTEMQMLMELMKKMDARMDKLEQDVFNKPANLPAKQHFILKPKPVASSVKKNEPAVCDRCGDIGHLGYGCRKGLNMTCHACGQIGHIPRSCRSLNDQ